ncbi:MAG TPA: dienelactone hydrolase family protein [Nocardioides sp.]|nr:dienelactone hydrolase family protein [Nocardioides sp.]
MIVLVDDATPEVEVLEVMNVLAVEGFESLAMVAGDGIEVLAEARARTCGWAPDQIGVVGVGAGGTLALEIARRRRLGAVVSLSPAPDVAEVSAAPALRTPWLGLFGSEAEDLSAADLALLRRVLDEGSDVFSQVVVYPGVGADFHRRTEDGVSFAASYDGWQRVTEWLLARVAARLTPLAQEWRDRHPVDG